MGRAVSTDIVSVFAIDEAACTIQHYFTVKNWSSILVSALLFKLQLQIYGPCVCPDKDEVMNLAQLNNQSIFLCWF